MVKNVDIDKEIMDIVKKYVEVILANYSVKAIILFGSYAKGTNHEDRIDEEIYLTKLRRGIDYRLEPHIIRIEDYKNIETPFIQEVINTGIKVV